MAASLRRADGHGRGRGGGQHHRGPVAPRRDRRHPRSRAGAAGVVVSATQLGYACGLVLVVPLGDVIAAPAARRHAVVPVRRRPRRGRSRADVRRPARRDGRRGRPRRGDPGARRPGRRPGPRRRAGPGDRGRHRRRRRRPRRRPDRRRRDQRRARLAGRVRHRCVADGHAGCGPLAAPPADCSRAVAALPAPGGGPARPLPSAPRAASAGCPGGGDLRHLQRAVDAARRRAGRPAAPALVHRHRSVRAGRDRRGGHRPPGREAGRPRTRPGSQRVGARPHARGVGAHRPRRMVAAGPGGGDGPDRRGRADRARHQPERGDRRRSAAPAARSSRPTWSATPWAAPAAPRVRLLSTRPTGGRALPSSVRRPARSGLVYWAVSGAGDSSGCSTHSPRLPRAAPAPQRARPAAAPIRN